MTIYTLEYFDTIPQMFRDALERHGDLGAYAYKDGEGFKYKTYREVRDIVEQIGMGLYSLGYRAGDKIAILSENKPEWIMTDYACAHFGIVTVPVYPTLLPEQVSYILNHSEAEMVFVSNKTQLEKITSLKDKVPALQQVVVYEGEQNYPGDWIYTFDELLTLGSEYKMAAGFSLEDKGAERAKDDLWTIQYTSGTTGIPKGVMLTHFNIVSNVQAAQAAVQFETGRRWVSFLPYSHSLERVAAHSSFWIGGTVYVIESIEYILNALKTFQPHYFVSVPRLYEKAYNSILHQIQTGSKLKRLLFKWATRVGRRVSVEYLQKNQEPHGWLALKYRLATKLVFTKITALFGGKAELTISGGAPLSRAIGQFFAAAGLIIVEGYGLTEMSPITHGNRVDNVKFGTVGPPLADVRVHITDDGEILLNGPNRMQGYYKDPAETAAAIDEDGWFHSGDIGYVDEDGHLVITDRKKNLIVTAGGKNIAPAPLEQRLSSSRYIDQSVVIGDRRKYVSALLVLNQEAVEYWAEANGIMNGEYSTLLKSREVHELISNEVKELQKEFARFEQVKKFAILDKPFTIEDGELTPSMKIKRRIVEEKYQGIIDSLYPGR